MRRFILTQKYWLWPVLAWMVLVLLSLGWNWRELDRHARDLALNEGRFVFRMVESVRLWNAGHGGVYVPVSEHTRPNPYLEIPERDITSRTGKQFTLLNPAYMTRQLADVVLDHSSILVHLTSLKPLNPGNKAKDWEAAALASFEQGVTEYSAFVTEEERTLSRYMAPLRVKEACMKCHKKQGYQVGDIRGGLSVVFPADAFLAPLRAEKRSLVVAHVTVWLLLSALTVLFLWRFRRQVLMLEDERAQQETLVEQRTAELKEQVRERVEAEEKLRLMINSSGEGIYGVDFGGNCTFCNPLALRLLGYRDAGKVLGRNMHDLVHRPTGDVVHLPHLCRLRSYLEGLPSHDENDVFCRADGESFPVEYRSHPIFSAGRVIGAVVTFSDIGVRLEKQKVIWKQANYDELTALPNRNLFYDRLDQAIAHAGRSGAQVALLFVDLDGFKAVNDRFGHEAGDELLRIAAERLGGCVRDSDTVARQGGDEFTIVLPQVARDEEVRTVAAKVLEQLCAPFLLGNQEVRVSASIGIAFYPRDGGNGITLIKHADLAMYQAKASGRNAWRFFSDEND